jgi:hypothetical protein
VSEPRFTRTVCDPNCHASPRCDLTARVEDGRITHIEAGSFTLAEYDRRIWAMGMARLEYQYYPDRLCYPMRRIGAQHGSRALAFFSESGAAGVLTKGRLPNNKRLSRSQFPLTASLRRFRSGRQPASLL